MRLQSRIAADNGPEEDPEIAPPGTPEKEEPDENKAMSAPVHELENKLFKQRTVLIFGAIDEKLARDVTARLLALSGDAAKPIDVFINSPGGHVESGDTIHDVIRFVNERSPVRVIGTGCVASAGALIYLAGTKERRVCLPNTRFLLHQPLGGMRGQATDIAIEAREIVKIRERINGIIARETGQPLEKIASDTDRNYWMNAEEAVTYGLVSRVVKSLGEL
jgi:ATP-dependent Clp protease protease subunit